MPKIISDTLQRGSASEWRTVVFDRVLFIEEVQAAVRCVGATDFSTKDGITWVITFPSMSSRFD